MTQGHSKVADQVIRNRLISVAEEQAQALVRTAFSTSVREAGNLSAGGYDMQSQMLVPAVTGTPGQVNAMAHFFHRIGRESIHDGDVCVTNDLWEGTDHLHDITTFILDNSRRATIEPIAALPQTSAEGEMTMDGFDRPITFKVKGSVTSDRIVLDFTGTPGLDNNGINCPLVYAKACACDALNVATAPEIPNNAARLALLKIEAPEYFIFDALHTAPVALRHILGHFVLGLVTAEGAGCLCNFQVCWHTRTDTPALATARKSKVLTLHSGVCSARPADDGLNATAFPSGVMSMPTEATEHACPVTIWRKEFRPDSSGPNKTRGGLGLYMEVCAQEGQGFDIEAMFDRVHHPARGRRGGHAKAPTEIAQDDSSAMNGKGKQSLVHGRRSGRAFPGGAGYRSPSGRSVELVKRDLARGYILAEIVAKDHNLSDSDFADVQAAVAMGETL